MKKVILKKLTINNFKGIKNLELDFNDSESFIRGDNATGKSTIADAISWLYEGKNVDGAHDTAFSIKPLDEYGNEIHHLETIVDCVFQIDGIQYNFKKIYSEKYVKARGSRTQEFVGNTTDYYIDGVKSTKLKYEKAIIDIFNIDKKTFSIISNVSYFMKNLNWVERRKIICDLADNVNYESILKMDEFKSLEIDIKKHQPEDYKKHCKLQLKDLESRRDEIPVKLKVLEDQNAQYASIPFELIEKKINSFENEITNYESSISSMSESTFATDTKKEFEPVLSKIKEEINQFMQEKSNLEMERTKAKSAFVAKVSDELKLVYDDKNYRNKLIDDISNDLRKMDLKISEIKTSIQEKNSKADKLRAEFKSISIDSLKHPFPFCNGCLHLELMNKNQIDDIKRSINAQGSKLVKEIEVLENQLLIIGENRDKFIDDIELNKNIIVTLNNTISEKSKQSFDTSIFDSKIKILDEYIKQKENEYQFKCDELHHIISKSDENSVEDKKADIRNKINETKNEIMLLREQLSLRGKLNENSKLKQKYLLEEENLNKQYDFFYEQFYLTECLIKEYTSRIEESINSKFDMVKFKLFKIQQNEGVREICEATVDGVPHNDLNTASFVNAGIDIINTLSAHYGVIVPLFIDNRESITKLIHTNSQIINLIKDESYNQLCLTDK